MQVRSTSCLSLKCWRKAHRETENDTTRKVAAPPAPPALPPAISLAHVVCVPRKGQSTRSPIYFSIAPNSPRPNVLSPSRQLPSQALSGPRNDATGFREARHPRLGFCEAIQSSFVASTSEEKKVGDKQRQGLGGARGNVEWGAHRYWFVCDVASALVVRCMF